MPTKTPDTKHMHELLSMVPNIRLIKQVAIPLFEAMKSDALNRHQLDFSVSHPIGKMACSILGRKAPIDDDDAEYYALCEKIAVMALRNIERSFYAEVARW